MTHDKISDLEQQIAFHRDAYYNDEPIISDQEFDELEDQLMSIDPDNKVLKQTGNTTKPSPWTKATHKIKMFSLGKLKDIHTSVDLYAKIATDTFVAEHKLDGISIDVGYDHVKNETTVEIVEGITRGDGVEGELITRNVIKMKNANRRTNCEYSFNVRGEIIITQQDFEEVNQRRLLLGMQEIANLRNGAGGIAKRLDSLHSEFCTILFYDIHFPNGEIEFDTEIQKIKFLEKLGFVVVPYAIINIDDVDKFYKDQLTKRLTLDYDIDGLVFKMNDLKRARQLDEGTTIPKSQIAWKFPASRIECQVIKVNWSMKQGDKITPVAYLKPLFILLPDGTKKPVTSEKEVQLAMGAKINNVTLNNLEWFKEKGLGLMDTVIIERANDVIPLLKQVVKHKGIKINIPQKCIVCNESTTIRGKFLYCNNESCPAKMYDILLKWISAHKIKDVGYETVIKLYKLNKVNEPSDFYKLKTSDLISIDNFGEKTADKIVNQFSKCKKMSLQTFLCGLAIDNIGEKTIEKIIEAGFNTIDKLFSIDENTVIDGFGSITINKLTNGIKIRKNIIINLLNVIEIVDNEQQALDSNKLLGKSFCITGTLTKKRIEIEQMVKLNGGILANVNKKLDFLIVGIDAGSKLTKAEQLNITCISENDFMVMLL